MKQKQLDKSRQDVLRVAKEAMRVIASTGRAGKEIHRDIKLDADLAAHTAIVEGLSAVSDFPIISEEDPSGFKIPRKGYFWIVDPIDGSVNYSRDLPFGGVSIGLWCGNEPLLGVVSTFTGDVFSGIVGLGAWKNEILIAIGTRSEINQAVLATGFPVNSDFSRGAIDDFLESARRVNKVRMLGSAAHSLCLTACGMIDLYAEKSVMFWDVGGALPIVVSAGGIIRMADAGALRVNVIAGCEALVQAYGEREIDYR